MSAEIEIQLVSHASVLLKMGDSIIWTDPWLFGKAFNESWSLYPARTYEATFLDRVQYLWISHEHPDHFHIPTLRSLPAEFKQRVRLLFQRNNSEKMFSALRKFGFQHFEILPHRRIVELEPGLAVYCYQVGQMDSMLGVRHAGHTVLNVNDAEINTADCRRVVRDFGKCEVLLNQFSLAGYTGFADREAHLPGMASRILSNMAANHRDLGAEVTIPFASFVYFSCVDNRYINAYANTPQKVVQYFEQHGLKVAVLYPGDCYRTGREINNESALERFNSAPDYGSLDYDAAPSVPLETIRGQFEQLSDTLRDRYTSFVLRSLQPFQVYIPDLQITVSFSLATRSMEESRQPPDLEINSQPLSFGFSSPFGFQTLGVSARYILHRNFRNWRNHRVLFALNNAEVYLRPKYFFRRRNLTWIAERLPGAMNQLAYRFRQMGPLKSGASGKA
jgi:hypothetical protein